MNIRESLRIGWRTIVNHRLRSVLTTIGIVIGVAAVITFVTLGTGLQISIVNQVSGQQPAAISVSTGPEGTQSRAIANYGRMVFTDHDVGRLQSTAGVRAVAPEAQITIAGLRYRNQTIGHNGAMVTTPSYFEHVSTSKFVAGRPFTSGKHEVVLNRPAATQYDKDVSVGDTVTFVRPAGSTMNATVVGILGPPNNVLELRTQPKVYAPVDPFFGKHATSPSEDTKQHAYSRVTVVADNIDRMGGIKQRITHYLRTSSDANALKPLSHTFIVQTNDDFINRVQRIVGIFTGFVTSVAVISLVVGAIGIMNVMLVSVTERTREIGIMKAVGAQNRDILLLFLIEAVILGVCGSIGGTLIGALTGYVAVHLIGIAWVFPIQWIGIAVAVGIGIGIISGLYPAWNAARTDPIDALRYE